MTDENNNSSNKTFNGVRRPKKTKFTGNIPPDYNVTAQAYLRNDIKQWISVALQNKTLIAVTLTMKQNIYLPPQDNKYFGYIDIDEPRASKNFEEFLNIFNYKIFGSAFKNKYKNSENKLEVVPFIEGKPNGVKKLHYHAIFVCPELSDKTITKYISNNYTKYNNLKPTNKIIFQDLLKNSWYKTNFANEHIHVKDITNLDGWISYCSKEYNFNVDIPNLHLKSIEKK